MNVTRRAFFRRLGVAAGGLGLAALGACASPTTERPAATTPDTSAPAFSFAYVTLGWSGTEVIHKRELLAKRGWSIAWQNVGPISGVVNAFAAGQLDVCTMSTTLAAQMHENGLQFRIVGAAVATLGAIVVPVSSTLVTVPDLRGRRVGGIPGSTTTQDINASIRKIHGLDLLSDTQFVQATAPPDLAALLQQGDLEAGIVWEPVTSQLMEDRQFRMLAAQQDLWEQASGLPGSQVHVVYIATPHITGEFAGLIADLNAAQAEVADMWRRQDPAVIDAIKEVTELPEPVVTAALERTTPLHGMTEDHIATIVAQLKQNREYGTLLKSDLWLDGARTREALFSA